MKCSDFKGFLRARDPTLREPCWAKLSLLCQPGSAFSAMSSAMREKL